MDQVPMADRAHPAGADEVVLHQFTRRTLLIGVAIAAIGIPLALSSEIVQPTIGRLLNTPWLVLLLFTALKPLLRLKGRDTALIFCFLLIAVTVPDAVYRMLPAYSSLQYFATPDGPMQGLFDRYVPGWFLPKDPEMVRVMYEGGPGWAGATAAWALPAALWATVSTLLPTGELWQELEERR